MSGLNFREGVSTHVSHVQDRDDLRIDDPDNPSRRTSDCRLEPSELLELVAVLGEIHDSLVPPWAEIRIIKVTKVLIESVFSSHVTSQG